MLRRPLRTLLILGVMALPMLGCTDEDPTGVGKKIAGKTGTPTTDASGGVGDQNPGGGTVTGPTAKPATPTPVPTPTAPPGFEGTTSRVGAVAIERPQAVGINPAGDVLVASWPRDANDPVKPYRLVVLSEFGAVKQQVDLATIPMAFGFRGTGDAAETYYNDGKNLVTLDATYSVKSSLAYTEAIPAAYPFAITPAAAPSAYKAVTASGQVFRYASSDTPETLAFPGGASVRALGFDRGANLWAAGGQTLVRYPAPSSGDPTLTIGVPDLGTLNSVGVVVSTGPESGNVWVLGSQKLAYYNVSFDDNGDLAIQRIAGPFNYGGDRVLIRQTGNYPVVVNHAAGTITWLKNDGSLDVGTSSGVSQATLDGGIAGAALDTGSNLWVSSKVMDLIRRTRF